MSKSGLAALLAAALLTAPGVGAVQGLAAETATAAAGVQALDGFWTMVASRIPKPALKPAIVARNEAMRRLRSGDKVVVPYYTRWCQNHGMPRLMEGTINLVVGKAEVGIIGELRSDPRHVFIDGRRLPDPDVADNISNGHSIGRWDGRSLVVQTIVFSDRGNTQVPGGGRRTSTSRLTERFMLSPDGSTLTVRSTWTDPNVYFRPFTYEVDYRRQASGHNAVGWPVCDPRLDRGPNVIVAPDNE